MASLLIQFGSTVAPAAAGQVIAQSQQSLKLGEGHMPTDVAIAMHHQSAVDDVTGVQMIRPQQLGYIDLDNTSREVGSTILLTWFQQVQN